MVNFAPYRALYVVLVALVGIERLFELRLSKRNARWSFQRGGVEKGRDHYVPMVLLHTGLLLLAPLEACGFHFSAPPWYYAVLGVGLALAQALRYWAVFTLGPQWNVRVIVVPIAEAVTGGPYRFFRHPNYVAVALEGLCLPLLGGAWRTAAAFFVLNAWFLTVRIRCEHRALTCHYKNYSQVGGRPL